MQLLCGFHVEHTINTQTTGRSSSARLPLPRNSPLVTQPDRPRHGFQVALPSKQTPSRTQHTPRCSHSPFPALPSPAHCPRFGTSSPAASTLKVSTMCCPACIIVTTPGENQTLQTSLWHYFPPKLMLSPGFTRNFCACVHDTACSPKTRETLRCLCGDTWSG